MATSLQYQASKVGGPFVVASVSKPEPEAGEVAVRMRAVALNPLDHKLLRFGLFAKTWPAVLGAEGAGIVEAVGSGVTQYKPGDEVMGMFITQDISPRAAAFQEIAVVDQVQVAKKPSNLSFAEAASLPIGFVTAGTGIQRALRIQLPILSPTEHGPSGIKSVLVLGGSSSVGSAAVQLLRLSLPTATILATNSPAHNKQITSIGATECFDQRSPTLIESIKAASPDGAGVDVIFDAVAGAFANKHIFDTLRADGPREFAEVLTGMHAEVPKGVKMIPVSGFDIFSCQGGDQALTAFAQAVDDGKYRVPIQAKVVGQGFEAIGAGLEELEAGVSGTKLVVNL